MKSVKGHRYAAASGAQLYDAKDGQPTMVLDGGSWLGVLDKDGEWLHVITAQRNGWVLQSDTRDAAPFTLKATFSNSVKGLIQNYIL